MAEWQIPAAWYVRDLTPEKAHEQMLTGNLGVEAVRRCTTSGETAINTGAINGRRNAGSVLSVGRKALCSTAAVNNSGLSPPVCNRART